MQILSAKESPSRVIRTLPVAPSDSVEEKAPPEPQDSNATEVGDDQLSTDAAARIGHFVRGMTHESLQHVRYLAGASAFRNVGSAIGSLALTPLAIRLASENAAVVGGVAIGGTVAAGALGGLLGYLWVRHHDEKGESEPATTSVFGRAADRGLDAASAWRALPDFIYPSVYGATDAQRETIYAALDKLPLKDATASASITVIPDLVDTGISGMAQPGASHVRMLLDQSYVDSPARAQGLIFHENGHAVDYSGGFGLLGSHNWRGRFGQGPHISDYAATNRYEDWAEMYEHFHNDPASVAAHPEKAEIIRRVSQQNPLQRAVDTPRVREAGKEAGKALGSVPLLRDGLELASSLIGPVQIYRGTGELLKGLENDDAGLTLRGKLNLASGLFLTLPGAEPLALASSVAGTVLKSNAEGKTSEAELASAHAMANGILATSAGPVGMTVAALRQELGKNGLHFDASHGFHGLGWQAAKAPKSALLKGTLYTVGGAVGGSLVGAAAGAALGGSTGAALGSLWGQMGGGLLGLGLYGAGRAIKEDKKTKNPLALTSGDKKFLVGLVGGGIAGAGAGTALGTLGGQAVGEWLGGALAGPSGAALGRTVVGWGGALLGGYGGAKLGAGLGSGRLLGRPLVASSNQLAPSSGAATPAADASSVLAG